MGKDFRLVVHDHDDRAEAYKSIFGSSTVFIKSPIVELVSMSGKQEKVAVYMLDMELIDDPTHDRLVAYLARKFGAAEEDITNEIGKRGLPIEATNTTVIVNHPQKWLMDDHPNRELEDKFDELGMMSDLDDHGDDEFDGYDEDYA